MLRKNVVPRWYKLTMKNAAGSFVIETVQAESPAAARLLRPAPAGWKITEVTPL